jgi:hypothetical protein
VFQHFVCAKCEKPFLGTRHYEKKGLAYCEIHYHQLFGNICFVCNNIINGDGKSPFRLLFIDGHYILVVVCYTTHVSSQFPDQALVSG